MHMSRPLSVLVLMAAMVTGAVWYAPPQQETALVTLTIPSDTYKLLALKAAAEPDATGRPGSVLQVIESFARQ